MSIISLDDLKSRIDKRNANRGSERGQSLIKKSIKEDGFARPVFAAADGTILGGNHAIKAVSELVESGEAMEEPLVIHSDGRRPIIHVRDDIASATDPKAIRLKLSDNRASQLNFTPDILSMREQMEEACIAPEDVGYDSAELEVPEYEAEPPTNESHGTESVDASLNELPAKDEIPERCKPGDLWALGDHRLLIGDCRKPADVGRLLDGKRINLAFTSPPYAGDRREYDPSSGFEPISERAYVDWFGDVQKNIWPHLMPDGSFFVNIKEGVVDGQRDLYVLELVIAMVRRWNWMRLDDFVWKRPANPGSWPNRFKNAFEPVYHFSRQANIKFNPKAMARPSDRCIDTEGERRGRGTGTAYGAPEERLEGLALPSNVIETQVSSESWHQAAFPIELPRFFIATMTDGGDSVYDPFGGSGTTLIASENLGRRCYLMEMSSRFGNTCLARFEKSFGVSAKLLDRLAK